MKTLEDIKPGHEVEVVKLKGQGTLRRHIMDMG
ncbi:MAG: ferrous iron transport protein A, partial [Eggerthellaceae bacterium]|nr:ferrous iron transport protein A [Eggerthellaceae bacterium]